MVIDGTCYNDRTPTEVIEILEHSRRTKGKLLFTYGDREGNVWETATPNRGHVGRSTGTNKIPLLIRTNRSLGGEAILDDCIVSIAESRGGKVLYRRHPSESARQCDI